MGFIIASIVIIIIIVYLFKRGSKNDYNILDEQSEDAGIAGQFNCKNFSYNWNSSNDNEDDLEVTFEVDIKSPYDFTLTEYILFCTISINKNYNFHGDEPRWGSGTTYGDWWPKDTKRINGSISIPKQDFKNTPQSIYFVILFKGRGRLPIEIIASFNLPISKWLDTQKELAVRP